MYIYILIKSENSFDKVLVVKVLLKWRTCRAYGISATWSDTLYCLEMIIEDNCLKTFFILLATHRCKFPAHLQQPTSTDCLTSLKSLTYLICSHLKYVALAISHLIFFIYSIFTSTACLPSLTSLSLSRGRLVLYLEAATLYRMKNVLLGVILYTPFHIRTIWKYKKKPQVLPCHDLCCILRQTIL